MKVFRVSKRRLSLLGFAVFISVPFVFQFWGLYKDWKTMQLQEDLIHSLIHGMSLEEKVGQLLHVGLPSDTLSKRDMRMLASIRPGGIILFKRNLPRMFPAPATGKNKNDSHFSPAETIKSLVKNMQDASVRATGIPLLVSIDQEGGRIIRIGPPAATAFPSAMSIGETQNPYFARLSAILTGAEMRSLGINLVLAPVLDVNNNPLNPVIGTRSFGTVKKRVTEMGKAYTAGALLIRSGPVIKHFPGHGNTDTDSHKALPVIKSDLASLYKTEIAPFKKSIQAGAPVVMVAHILFPALDADYPASLSRKITTGLLRKSLGFEGLIMTDALEMKAVAKRYKELRVARLALQAGADILLFADPKPGLLPRVQKSLVAAYKKGELSLKELDQSLERQLRYKLRAAIFQDYYKKGKYPKRLRALEKSFRAYDELTRFDPQAIVKDALSNYKKEPSEIAADICKASARSYGGPLSTVSQEGALLFYRSPDLKKRAQAHGMNDSQTFRGGLPAFRKALQKGTWNVRSGQDDPSSVTHILIELRESDLGAWNRLLSNKSLTKRLPDSAMVVALYSGNPFHKIQTSVSRFELLLTPSPAKICMTGLLDRILDRRHPEIPESDLPVLE